VSINRSKPTESHPDTSPFSENIALPALPSEASIRVLDHAERKSLFLSEERQLRRPIVARLVVALLALVLGGVAIWSQRAPEIPAPTARP